MAQDGRRREVWCVVRQQPPNTLPPNLSDRGSKGTGSGSHRRTLTQVAGEGGEVMDDVAPVHVLVVDDVAASRGLASIWLSDGLRGGVEVVEAATLAEMRAAWVAHRPDVVVLDQRLPDGEGLDGARELLAEDPDATIILLTGMADPALDQEAERIGVADFL